MASSTPDQNANLWPAILWFSVAYLAASVVVAAVLMALDVDSNSGVSAALLVASTAAGAQKFVGDNGRSMRRSEQLRFALFATLALIPLSVLQGAAVVFYYIKPADLAEVAADGQAWAAANATFLGAIIVFVVLFSFAVLYFASGWLSRSFEKRLPAAKSI